MRVLLVDNNSERAAAVSAGLTAAGHRVAATAAEVADLTGLVRGSGAELVVCDLDDPSREALEGLRALHRDEARPVVVFAESGEPGQIEAALAAGVAAYVVAGLAPARLGSVIEVAIRRWQAQQALALELAEARRCLAERQAIDRAKQALMRRHRMTEPEAYRRLRRLAMDSGRKLVQVAVEVLGEK